jgi:hypothetical protein
MSSVILVHPEEQFEVPVLHAITKCNLFQNNVALAAVPYKIRSLVPLGVFQQFVVALNGNAVATTDANLSGLLLLCEEFGFEALGSQLLELKQSTKQKRMGDTETRAQFTAFEERMQQRDHDIEVLRATCERFTALEKRMQQRDHDVVAVSELRIDSRIRPELCASGGSPPSPQQPPVPSVPSLDSRIISDFPGIFAEFRRKRFSLLLRGSRDGFAAQEFHRLCDGHANTLTVILDTEGNVFGGFTPVEWESGNWHYKADDSQKSFLFTLKNPHNIPARRFALKAEMKHGAIYCDSARGPCFGSSDIVVCDNCNANTRRYTSLEYVYTNNTILHGKVVFTGSQYFQVKEIEVFEITG